MEDGATFAILLDFVFWFFINISDRFSIWKGTLLSCKKYNAHYLKMTCLSMSIDGLSRAFYLVRALWNLDILLLTCIFNRPNIKHFAYFVVLLVVRRFDDDRLCACVVWDCLGRNLIWPHSWQRATSQFVFLSIVFSCHVMSVFSSLCASNLFIPVLIADHHFARFLT